MSRLYNNVIPAKKGNRSVYIVQSYLSHLIIISGKKELIMGFKWAYK